MIGPTLVAISLIAFFMSIHVPQDPALSLATIRGVDPNDVSEKIYDDAYRELGMHRPDFYFSVTPHNYPATTNKYSSSIVRDKVKDLLKSGIPHDAIAVDNEIVSVSDNTLVNKKNGYPFFPKLHWNGSKNRYHLWLSSFFSGTFGISVISRQPVKPLVWKAFQWTATLSIIAILFTFIFGIGFAILLSNNPDSRRNKFLSQFLYLIYAVPIFWLATMLVMYLTTDSYSSAFNIFPSVGIDVFIGESTFNQILGNAKRFILPVICASLSSIAYVARVLRRSILDEMQEPYITTALSKGLSEKQAMMRHAFPNALLPLITIIVGSIPATLGGAVVIEVIFNIPGVGRLLYNAIGIGDWNIAFCIIIIVGFITIISYLIGDLLYTMANPKIRFA